MPDFENKGEVLTEPVLEPACQVAGGTARARSNMDRCGWPRQSTTARDSPKNVSLLRTAAGSRKTTVIPPKCFSFGPFRTGFRPFVSGIRPITNQGENEMKAWSLLALIPAVAIAQQPSTSFTLGAVTANCIPVLSQDGAATPPLPPGSGPAVCPGGFFGNGDYEIYLLTDHRQSGQHLTLYGCQANWGPLVPANPKTNPQTATETIT